MTPNLIFLLWCILFLAGYLALFAALQQDLPNRRMLPVLAFSVLFLYLCTTLFTWLLYQSFGGDPLLLYGVLVFYAAVTGIYLAGLFLKLRHEIRSQVFVWMAANLLAVFYVTLASRLVESHSLGTRLIPFQNLIRAAETGSLDPLGHSFLNLILFLPTGFLLAHLGPRRCRRLELGFLTGLVLSTAIETIQLIARLGLCDINDIVANALGAAAGVLIHNFLFPRWKRPRA